MKKLLLICLLLSSSFLLSQNENSPYIEVQGTSEIYVEPNEIYIDICIKERIEKGDKLTIDFLENQLKNTLGTIGIDEKDLYISNINAVLSKTGWWSKEVLSVANYTLKIKDVSKLKKLFEQFEKLKITDVKITKATHSDIINIRKKNRIQAIKNAKEKADYMPNAIGENTGKPLVVNELNNNYQNFVTANTLHENVVVGYSSKIKSSRYKASTTQFEKLKIKTSVYVKFKIK